MVQAPASSVAMIEPLLPCRVVSLTGWRELPGVGVGVAALGVLVGLDVAVGSGVEGVPVGVSVGPVGVAVPGELVATAVVVGVGVALPCGRSIRTAISV